MGIGYLKVEVYAAGRAVPVEGASVVVTNDAGETLCQPQTDASGTTQLLTLEAPDACNSQTPESAGPFYASCNVMVTAPGYQPVSVRGVQIYDGQTSILPVEMHPVVGRTLEAQSEIVIPPPQVLSQQVWMQQGPTESRMQRSPVMIPESIVVHLGAPNTAARNVRVNFSDYIKNVASSEIYPTWPQASLEANIYAIISFALNRVYTEWYVSRGYGFHITNSTAYDQYFVEGRNIYGNISAIVDNIFNIFVRRTGFAEPYFTAFCNGTTATCSGLSQWGTVSLANQGLDAYGILRSYYPQDIQLVRSELIGGITESYPGVLREGSRGESVRTLQTYLNRIRVNYPLIPQISPVDGIFGPSTQAAVRVFQSIFDLTADGVVGRATWYKTVQIHTSVRRLAELDSEGIRVGIGDTPPTAVLREGSRGGDVAQLQFILNYLADFYSDLSFVLENSLFDNITKQAVISFQAKFSLTADGIVGAATWRKLYEVYKAATATHPGGGGGAVLPPYPGTLLKEGSRGENVRLMQRYLNGINGACPAASKLSEDGIFGPRTLECVLVFQGMAGLNQDGIIGPLTWSAIVETYSKV